MTERDCCWANRPRCEDYAGDYVIFEGEKRWKGFCHKDREEFDEGFGVQLEQAKQEIQKKYDHALERREFWKDSVELSKLWNAVALAYRECLEAVQKL